MEVRKATRLNRPGRADSLPLPNNIANAQVRIDTSMRGVSGHRSIIIHDIGEAAITARVADLGNLAGNHRDGFSAGCCLDVHTGVIAHGRRRQERVAHSPRQVLHGACCRHAILNDVIQR